MTRWRTALAVGEVQQHMSFPAESEAPASPGRYMFERKRKGPEGVAALKVGDTVMVTPDEDDEIAGPFVGTISREPSYNDIFEQFVYAVKTPEGSEVSVFESQLQPA